MLQHVLQHGVLAKQTDSSGQSKHTTSRFFAQPSKRDRDHHEDDPKGECNIRPKQRSRPMLTRLEAKNGDSPGNLDVTLDESPMIEDVDESLRGTTAIDYDMSHCSRASPAPIPAMKFSPVGVPAWLFDEDDFSKVYQRSSKCETKSDSMSASKASPPTPLGASRSPSASKPRSLTSYDARLPKPIPNVNSSLTSAFSNTDISDRVNKNSESVPLRGITHG